MQMSYFNYSSSMAVSRWDRGSFARAWWRLSAQDPFWTAPYYPALRSALEPGNNPHLARMQPLFASTAALRREINRGPREPDIRLSEAAPLSFSLEQVVAAAVGLKDPRRRDGAAYLGLLHTVNDRESLARLLGFLLEEGAEQGYRRLIGPTALSPMLGYGLLVDGWNHVPPVYAMYNPPYTPELFERELQPLGEPDRLYTLETAGVSLEGHAIGLGVQPLRPEQLAGELLPLVKAAHRLPGLFPPPDRAEVRFLLDWYAAHSGAGSLRGWIAHLGERPVGFLLAGPDVGPYLKSWGGGRSVFQRAAYALLRRSFARRARQGRLLLGGVLPEYRGQGAGSRLLNAVLEHAREAGWQSLSCGPLPENSPGAQFLTALGAHPGPRYQLYHLDIY